MSAGAPEHLRGIALILHAYVRFGAVSTQDGGRTFALRRVA